MRRKDREVTDIDELVSIINKCEVIRIAMIDNGKPYIVPLNFGFENVEKTIFYFHSAAEGRKINILNENPYVCFELDCSFKIVTDEVACKWSAEHESIIGYGEISFIDNYSEKVQAMDCIMKKYGHIGKPIYNEAVFSKTILYKLVVSEITGKRNIRK